MGPSLADYRLRAYPHSPPGYRLDPDRYTDYDDVCLCSLSWQGEDVNV